MARKQLRFWLGSEDSELQEYLESLDNYSQVVKDVLNKYRKGQLFSSEEEEDLRKQKLKADIQLKIVTIKIREKELQYYEIFHQIPSSKGKRAMRINVENQIEDSPSCLDEKNHRIMCPECGACFVFAEDQHDISDSKEYFIDHYIQKHGLKFPPQLTLELKSF